MSQSVKISKKLARRIALSHQGLNKPQSFGRGKNATFRVIDQIGYVQLDTISVVERAHHHVVHSRVGGYQKKYLTELQKKDRKLFEYWSHAAAILPMKDYRFSMVWKDFFRNQKDRWPKSDQKVKDFVLDRISAEGPLMARQFEAAQKRSGQQGWWEWRPAKLALQRLFFEGVLMVSHREGFQRVYDLPERVVPDGINTIMPTIEEYATHLINRSIRAHGFTNSFESAYLRRDVRKEIKKQLQALVHAGDLVSFQIEKTNGPLYVTRPSILQEASSRISKKVNILSPFDNLVIQRERLKTVFNFDYQIECYVPRPKRVFGYFSLPILYGDNIIGRMDTKADRKSKTFHVFNLVFENGFKITDQFLTEWEIGFRRFVDFNGCEHFEFTQESQKPIELLL